MRRACARSRPPGMPTMDTSERKFVVARAHTHLTCCMSLLLYFENNDNTHVSCNSFSFAAAQTRPNYKLVAVVVVVARHSELVFVRDL